MARVFLVCGHYADLPEAVYSGKLECPWGDGMQDVDAAVLGVGQILGDMPEHYNPGLDAVVTGRRSFARLCREQGASDYEPSAATRERMKEVAERRKFDGRR